MTDHGETSTTHRERPTVAHPFVSDTALELLAARPDGGWIELDGSLAKYDVSGFTTLAERLARAGRQGAEHINDVLTTTFDRLIEIAMSFGGDVLEFGRGVVAFTAPGAWSPMSHFG